jgi:hypothetical protein
MDAILHVNNNQDLPASNRIKILSAKAQPYLFIELERSSKTKTPIKQPFN